MIKLLFMDVDGTLTDGRIIWSSDGVETKSFSVKDGMGISLAIKSGIIPVIVTGRRSECVTLRAKELNIEEVYQAVSDKTEIILQMMDKYSATKEELAYIGDDVNDISSMKYCGIIGAPCDASDEVKRIATFVSSKKGGDGAVRDFINYLLSTDDT